VSASYAQNKKNVPVPARFMWVKMVGVLPVLQQGFQLFKTLAEVFDLGILLCKSLRAWMEARATPLGHLGVDPFYAWAD